jgi:3-methylcrotonyl-CoA carboxylase alpha subunit
LGFGLEALGVEGVTSVRTGIFTVRHGDQAHRVTITSGDEARVDEGGALSLAAEGEHVVVVTDGERTRRVFVAGSGERRQVFVDGEAYELTVGAESAGRRRSARSGSDLLAAPMPARVTAILVEAGQQVRKGDVLLKLEAMKMELAVRAPRDGVVRSIACRAGELVQPGVGLMEIA